MLLDFNYYSLSLFLGGMVALATGFVVFINNPRKKENRAWMYLNLVTAVWSFGYYAMITASDHQTALLSNWILHLGAILIPPAYFYFILRLTDTFRKYRLVLLLISLIGLFFFPFDFSPLFVRDVIPKYPFNFAPDAGILYGYFTAYFFLLVFLSGYVLLRKIFVSAREEARRLQFVFWSSLAGFVGGGSVFLLTFNIPIPPYPIVFFTFYPVIIAYAIRQLKLFNTKVISTEILTFVLWALLLFRTLLATSLEDQIFNFVLFVALLILGVFLIRSVVKEVEAREEVERLATDLAKANDRLKELDQMKSEFLSLATHQIRGPLTAIKGYASLLLEGSYGKLPPAPSEAVEKIFHSSDSLALLVEDFLNISRIEQGKMKYDFVDTDMEALIREVAGELAPNVAKAKLQFGVSTDGRGPYKAKVDVGKIRQVIANLIDNAIKYTPSGSISVGLEKSAEGKIRIEVSDTGIGIDPETIPTLFNKFIRAKDASKTNVSGTGLGLYVAKEMIKAHGGRIWVESAGKGHGSIFFVELKAL